MTSKLKKIDYIKGIVRDFGTFSANEIGEGATHPYFDVDKENKSYKMIERFHEHRVGVISYVGEDEIDTDYVSYEDLSEEVIEMVFILANDWNTCNMY